MQPLTRLSKILIPTLLLTLGLTALLAACGAPTTNRYYGNFAMTLKDYEQAVEKYQAALKDNPDSVVLLTNLGRAYYNLGEYGKALEQFRHAMDVEDYPMASFYYGVTRIVMGEREAGFEHLARFRYTGKTEVTESVRDMATRLARNEDASTEYITRKLFAAWDEGMDRQRQYEAGNL